jgi:hypothetical protein
MRAPMRLLALLTVSLAATAFAQEGAGEPTALPDASLPSPSDAGLPADTTLSVTALEADPAAAQYSATTMQTLAVR